MCLLGVWSVCSYLSYLSSVSVSSQSVQVHSCSSLLCSSHFNVWRLIVSIVSWLEILRAGPLMRLERPVPRLIPFPFNTSRVWDSSFSSSLNILSWADASTVAGSRVSVPPIWAWPANSSARSFPLTPAWPGQKIHLTLLRLLSHCVPGGGNKYLRCWLVFLLIHVILIANWLQFKMLKFFFENLY